MVKRDIILVFSVTLFGLLSLYLSDFGLLQKEFIFAFESYLLLLFFIGSVILRSVKHGFMSVFSAFMTVSLLSLLHGLSFNAYDALSPVAYFVVILFSFLLNLFAMYGKYIKDKPLFRVYEDNKATLTAVVISTVIASLFIASQKLMEQFGILTMVGAGLSYLMMLFYLSALVRLDRTFEHLDFMSKDEKRVKKFVSKYGKSREVFPFFASWLGISVGSVENDIDNLESKGHMGHNFFSAHAPFFWFSTLLSFFMGVSYAGGVLVQSFFSYVVLMSGIALVGPQRFMKRTSRRLMGTAIIMAALSYFYLLGPVPFRFGVLSSLLSLVSIYFAYRDDEIISMGFASFFVGSLFVLGHSLYKPPMILQSYPLVITGVTFVLLVYEYFLTQIKDRQQID